MVMDGLFRHTGSGGDSRNSPPRMMAKPAESALGTMLQGSGKIPGKAEAVGSFRGAGRPSNGRVGNYFSVEVVDRDRRGFG